MAGAIDNIMEQPTLTPSAAASAAPLFLPTMPTSWFASLDKKPNLSDRFLNNNDSHPRLSGDGGGEPSAALVHEKSSNSEPMTATSLSIHGSNVATNMTTDNSLVEVRQPIPLKPTAAALQPIGLSTSSSTMDESKRDQLPLPSLHSSLYKSDESNSDVLQHYARMPMMNAPQLRMRPVSIAKETQNTIITMPSPIARRGEAERAFLQRQMKAEALIRREQARHNQERKLRNACTIMPIDPPPCSEGERQQEEGLPISHMAQHPTTADGNQPINRKHSRQQFLREFASSPPLILKKSFKRSVSAVLADSGIAENGNLLFFPDGLPLLNEQEEVVAALNDVAGGDGDSATESPGGSGTAGGGGDDGSVDVDASEKGTPRESTTSTNEPSPSLIAADLIWQIGASSCDDDDLANELPMPHQLSKKVTLRPKMNNAPCLTNSTGPNSAREFKPIGAGGITSDGTCCLSLSHGKKSIGCSSDDSNEDKLPYDFARRDNSSRDILSASESFQHLSFENDDTRAWGALNRSDSMGRAGSSAADGNKVPPPFTFSSPEPGRNRQIFSSVAVDPSSSQHHPNELDFLLKEPMSDLNYCTPDNSESKRFNRKIPTERLPRLPELGMPDVLHDSNEETRLRSNTAMSVEEGVEDDQFEIVLNEHMAEINFYTPEVTQP
jgi:hypothetical protein